MHTLHLRRLSRAALLAAGIVVFSCQSTQKDVVPAPDVQGSTQEYQSDPVSTTGVSVQSLSPTGSVSFYTAQPTGWSSISVTLAGSSIGSTSRYFSTSPACQAVGTINTTRPPGIYAYTARSNTGTVWNGTVTIRANVCSQIRLDFPAGSTGGGSGSLASRVVFWTNTSAYGSISVYVNNTYQGTVGSAYSGAPSCGASGCVTVTVSGQNNTWYATAGRYRWTGSYTLQSGCTALVLR